MGHRGHERFYKAQGHNDPRRNARLSQPGRPGIVNKSRPSAEGVSETLHALALGRAATDPFCLGRRPADLRSEQGLAPTGQAATLGLSLDALAFLALCRMLGSGEAATAERIVGTVGMVPGRLERLLGSAAARWRADAMEHPPAHAVGQRVR
jgi:hypothetical protein